MASDRPDDFEELLGSLRDVIPFVRAIRFPRAAVTRTELEVITTDEKTFTHQAEKTYWGNSMEFDMDGAPGIPARMASEGTMLVLALLTAIMSPQRPQIVLLDDLDRALHPKAQEDLVRLLRKLLEKNPEMQIVATSHSPYLPDHLAPEEVRLTVLDDQGAVVAGRLDEHPEFGKWKETMAPGEFWSMVGERWLLEAGSGDSQ